MISAAILFAIALPAAALASGGPASEPEVIAPQSLDMPAYEEPAREWRSIEDALPAPEECRDRIHQVREAAGQPELDREPASTDKPVMIWAVDRRMDGCAVLVVMGDPQDIRPIPESSGKVEKLPAH